MVTKDEPFATVWPGVVGVTRRQYEPALAELERPIALDPNNAGGYASLAEVLSSKY